MSCWLVQQEHSILADVLVYNIDWSRHFRLEAIPHVARCQYYDNYTYLLLLACMFKAQNKQLSAVNIGFNLIISPDLI